MRGALCAAALALAACGSSGSGGGRSADPGPAKAAPAGSGEGTAAASGSASLPPIEVGCTDDRDCALADVHLQGPDTCCQGCNIAYAARADWVQRIRAACAARKDLIAHCLPLNCPVGVQRAVCREGRCAVTP